MLEKAKEFIEEVKPKKKAKAKKVIELRDDEVIVKQPGTPLFKTKIGYRYLGMFQTEELAYEAILKHRK